MSEDRTELLDILPFWTKHSVESSFLWETCIVQFLLVAKLKVNIILNDRLVDPATIADEPPSKPETPAVTRLCRDQAAVRIADDWNAARRRKYPRTDQNWFYHEAEAHMKSRFFFSLGNERRRLFTYSIPHLNLNTCSFKFCPAVKRYS